MSQLYLRNVTYKRNLRAETNVDVWTLPRWRSRGGSNWGVIDRRRACWLPWQRQTARERDDQRSKVPETVIISRRNIQSGEASFLYNVLEFRSN